MVSVRTLAPGPREHAGGLPAGQQRVLPGSVSPLPRPQGRSLVITSRIGLLKLPAHNGSLLFRIINAHGMGSHQTLSSSGAGPGRGPDAGLEHGKTCVSWVH